MSKKKKTETHEFVLKKDKHGTPRPVVPLDFLSETIRKVTASMAEREEEILKHYLEKECYKHVFRTVYNDPDGSQTVTLFILEKTILT